jgi:hypothetical protein
VEVRVKSVGMGSITLPQSDDYIGIWSRMSWFLYQFYYYDSITRELKRRLIYEYRYDERLKTKTEESTRLADTGLVVKVEHLKIFLSVMPHRISRAPHVWLCGQVTGLPHDVSDSESESENDSD